jgi:hypothetical protein
VGEYLIITLRFSSQQIRHEPADVIQRIKGALQRGLQRPSLPILTIARPAADRPSQ